VSVAFVSLLVSLVAADPHAGADWQIGARAYIAAARRDDLTQRTRSAERAEQSNALQRDLSKATARHDDLTKADALDESAAKLSSAGKPAQAAEAAKAAVEIRERVQGPSHPDVAASLSRLGYAQYQQRDMEAAMAAFTRAVTIRRTAKAVEPEELADSLNNLASVYRAVGRLRDVEPLLVESLGLLERGKPNAEQLGAAYNNLGELYRQLGDYARATERLSRAADIWPTVYPADHPRIATLRNNLGLAEQALGRLADAERDLRASLAIREKGGETASLATGLNNLAQALQEQGRLDEAEPLYLRAIAIHEKVTETHESPSLAQALNNLAVLYLLKWDLVRAQPLYERALAMREKLLGASHPDVATSLQAYAVFLNNSKRVDEAMDVQARATDIIERNAALTLEVGSESQKEQYLRLFADTIDVTLWMRSHAGSAAADATALLTVLRRKGRIQDVLAASSDALRASGRANTADLDRLAGARADLARLQLGAGGGDQRARAIKDLQEKIDALESMLSARSAALTADRRVTVDAVRAAIPAGAVLIEFFKYRPFDTTAVRAADRFGAPRYAACALAHDGPPRWIELGDAGAVDEKIAALRAALLNPSRTDVRERGADLAPLLTEPLSRLTADAERILIAPDGELNLLPFEALVGSDGRFLVERHLVTYLTSGRDLLRTAEHRSSTPPLIVSNPAFGSPAVGSGGVSRTFEPLPGAKQEARAVARLLPLAQTLSGPLATEARLKAVHGPVVLHIATHGFFLSDAAQDVAAGTRGLRPPTSAPPATLPPLFRSGLALAGANRHTTAGEDGILTASEAASLDLRGTQLVFLSACESGLGVVNAGESVYGLRRAFAIAGAASQVLTLWQVSDLATRTFVVDFYTGLRRGLTRAEALRAAQRAALADPSRDHPFYWAAFILSGDGSALPLGGVR
jgi:CHAT domain-containing protein